MKEEKVFYLVFFSFLFLIGYFPLFKLDEDIKRDRGLFWQITTFYWLRFAFVLGLILIGDA